MGMTPQSAENLVVQLQQAHRIAVAFYRRILPTLDLIAAELNCEFSYWEPIDTSPPPRKSSKPSASWAWDFMPLLNSSHVYRRTNGGYAQPSDVGLWLSLYVDTGLTQDQRTIHNISGEPDAISLPVGNALLQAWIYRPIAASEQSLDQVWADAALPEIGTDVFQTVAENCRAIVFEWPLSDVIQDVSVVVQTLKIHVR